MSHTLDGELSRGELIVNLRAEGDPARLAAAVDAAILDAADAQSLVVSVDPFRALPARTAEPDPPARAGLVTRTMSSRVLYCHCAFAQAVPRPVKQDVLRALTDRGDDFDAVADLCEMSARKDPALKEFAACGQLTLAACYPRALRWMFSAAGAPLDESKRARLNMRRRRPSRSSPAWTAPRRHARRRAGRCAGRRTSACRGARPMSASITARSPLLVVLYEGAGAMPLDAEARFEITRTLLEKGYRIITTRAGRSGTTPGERQVLVLGRFTGEPPAEAVAGTGAAVHFRSLDGVAPADVVALVEGVGGDAQTQKPGGWKPWFPVIDYSAAPTACSACSFCLFDVYGVSKDKQDSGAEPDQLQDRLPGLLARLPGSGDHVPEVHGRPDQRRRGQRRRPRARER